MDSLLANYASSDEEEEQQPPKPTLSVPPKTTSSSSPFSSLPQPKSSSSSSLFQSLPQPKQPSPATDPRAATLSNFSDTASLPKPKRVVQFKPPIIPLPNPTQLEDDDDEEEEEEERNRRRKLESSTQTPSAKSFLSSIPAPRNTATLGVQSSSGSGRRSILETDAPEPEPAPAPASNSGGSAMESNVPVDQIAVGYDNYQYGTEQYASYGNYSSGIEPEAAGNATCSYGNNDNSYGAYGDYGQYANNWVDGSAEASGVSDSTVRIPGKRGRHEVPSEVIEVKQEELIKNRPREDQAKLTGIAFGPSYQPVSAKGKPSKLHKRKHQIGSLYFEMKQNEMKLAERRAKGMLTKAETQAKYGW